MNLIILKRVFIFYEDGKQEFELGEVAKWQGRSLKVTHLTYYPDQRLVMIRDEFNILLGFTGNDIEFEALSPENCSQGNAMNFIL